MSTGPHLESKRPTRAKNDAEREAQVTEIITRLDRVLAEAATLREELERLNGAPLPASTEDE